MGDSYGSTTESRYSPRERLNQTTAFAGRDGASAFWESAGINSECVAGHTPPEPHL